MFVINTTKSSVLLHLYKNSTGNANTAVGAYSSQLLNSDNNTSVGAYSLANNADGMSNVAFGTNSLLKNINGKITFSFSYQ